MATSTCNAGHSTCNISTPYKLCQDRPKREGSCKLLHLKVLDRVNLGYSNCLSSCRMSDAVHSCPETLGPGRELETSMRIDLKRNHLRRAHTGGFSLVELAVVLAVIMIITAVSLPYFLQAYGTYQLNDAATQVAGILKFTRYEAIRRNGPVSAQIRQVTSPRAMTNIWTDSNADGTEQNTEKQILLDDNIVLDASSVPPSTAALATAVGVSALTAVSFSSSAGSITFDQRGAVTPSSVRVLYVGNTARQTYGYRAVVLFPSGSVQIWTADATASAGWNQIN